MLPPYTYTMMKEFVWSLVRTEEENKYNQEDGNKEEEQKKNEFKQAYPKIVKRDDYQIKVDLAGNSLAGLDIPVIEITNNKNNK